jgi:Spy/CpxP family protein refolding chaperone
MATLAQMRAASLNQIYQTLTPEQRKKADELKNRFDRQTPRQSPRRRVTSARARVASDAGST